jgi:hypothetical protein
MDNAQAQIEELQQQVTLLRKQLAQSDARMLTCLAKANANILACQTEFAMFKDAIKKDTTKTNADRAALDAVVKEEFNALWKNSRLIEHKIVEIHQFLWPVVENIFPNLLAKCTALSKRFKEPGLYSEPKRR